MNRQSNLAWVVAIGTVLNSCVRMPATTTTVANSRDLQVDWVRQHVVPVRTIDPVDEDFADLIPLDAALSRTQVVLLGGGHGGGSDFLAMTRLIKFLHQQMGFDVLVFESGFYDCARAWPPRDGSTAMAAFENCAWAMWSQRRELEPLVAYLDRTRGSARPLALAGLDPDLGMETAYQARAHELRSLLERLPPVNVPPEKVAELLDFAEHAGDYRGRTLPVPSVDSLRTVVGIAEELASELRRNDQLSRNDRTFWALVLEGLAAETRARLITRMYSASPPDPEAAFQATLERDRQMARNLFWLLNERYPGQKAIVWTATVHAARRLNEVTLLGPVADQPTPFGFSFQELFRRRRVLGDYLRETLGDRVYTMSFISSHRLDPQDSLPRNAAPAGSLEEVIGRTGTEFAFLDLRHMNTGSPVELVARPFGPASVSTRWNSVLDGFFFIRTRTPSTRRTPQ